MAIGNERASDPPLNLPFVAVADGARIYLGTFLASLSSISPTGPNANVDDITSDDVTLKP